MNGRHLGKREQRWFRSEQAWAWQAAESMWPSSIVKRYVTMFPNHPRLAPLSVFRRRLAKAFLKSCAFIGTALVLGVVGYHWIAGLEWIDSLLNASMILGGMGPVDDLQTSPAKLFASFYALFSGLIFVVAMGIVLSPILHRMMHKFHLDDADSMGESSPASDAPPERVDAL